MNLLRRFGSKSWTDAFVLDTRSKSIRIGYVSPDKQAAIFARYPEIFRDRTKPMTQTCMCWGLECGNGWEKIIDALCAAIQKPYSALCSTTEDGSDEFWSYEFPQVVADQVKEKFGGLRFYYHLEPDAAFQEQAKRFPKTARTIYASCSAYVDGAIGLAEVLSGRTCEVSGQPGEHVVRNGWHATLSPEVAARKDIDKAKEQA